MQKPVDISDSVQNGEDVSPCALELFAGSCKLSKCLKMHGFAAFGIDHQKCKNRVGPCVVMDLTKKSSRSFLKKMIPPLRYIITSQRKTYTVTAAAARSSRAKAFAER